jgi:WD40 repeat protein
MIPLEAANPYPGLRPFREDEEHLFFGREHQVDRMVDRLAATHFLAVVGTSGSGKSSLVNCGLRPALHRGLMAGAGIHWKVAQFRPGNRPVRALAVALARAAGMAAGAGTPFEPADFVETTLRSSPLGLLDACEQAGIAGDTNLLVVADQFEELFRYRDIDPGGGRGAAAAEDATAFVNLLLEVAQRRPAHLFVVLTMRSDYLGDCAQFHGLPEAINTGQYLVPRLTREERRLAVAGPAGVAGARISPILLTRLVNDVGDNPDQLSILQHALNRTWAHWAVSPAGTAGEPIALAHYESIGTMAHALDAHAEHAYAELPEPRRRIAERLFRALTDRSTDPRGIRRPTPFGALCEIADAPPDEVAAVIDAFRRPGRSFLMPPAGDALGAQTVVDISHESLMRVWQRLTRWSEDERESVKAYLRLAADAELHESTGRNLLSELNLQLALQWRATHQPNAAWAARYHAARFDSVMAYLERSRQAQQAEHLRRRRRLFAFRAGAAVLLLAAVAVAAVMTSLSMRANEQEALALASSLLTKAKDARAQGRVDRALLLAVASMQSRPTNEAKSELIEWLQGAPQRILRGHESPVSGLAFDASHKRLASTSIDGELRVWDLADTGTPWTGEVAPARRQVMAFAADGRSLMVGAWAEGGLVRIDFGSGAAAAATVDAGARALAGAVHPGRGLLATAGMIDRAGAYSVRLWRPGGQAPWGELRGLAAPIIALAFSPDGALLAGADESGTVRLWRIGDDAQRLETAASFALRGETFEAQLRFSPDGRWLAAAAGGSLILWDTNAGRPVHELTLGDAGRRAAPGTMAFSPDSRALALAWTGVGIGLWETRSGKPFGSLTALPSELRQLLFSPDGRLLAGGGDDGSLWLWNLRGRPLADGLGAPARLVAHRRAIDVLAFSPDSRLLASGGDDRQVTVWDVAPDRPVRGMLAESPAAMSSLAWRRDGAGLAFTSEEGFVGYWRTGDREHATPDRIDRPERQLTAVAFSDDGRRLAFGSRDGVVEVLAGGTDGRHDSLMQRALGTDVVVSGLAFRPRSSRWLACAGLDGRIRLLDLDAGASEAAELGHPDVALDDGRVQAKAMVRAIAFSPDGRTLASADDRGRLVFWTVGDDGRAAPLGEPVRAHDGDVTSLAFDPGGRWLYSGGLDRRVRRWDLAGRKQSGRTLETVQRVMSVAVSADGKSLAAGMTGGLIALWDLERMVPVSSALPGHRRQDDVAGDLDITYGVAFSPDGLALASVGSDGKLRIWDRDLRATTLRQRACSVTRERLAGDDWPTGARPPAQALDPCGAGAPPPPR